MQKQDDNRIKREFKQRQSRQIVAITLSLFMVILGAALHRRPDLLGSFSPKTLFGMQALTIAAFLVYTTLNWRCPACGKGLGSNLYRAQCGKCGVRLQ